MSLAICPDSFLAATTTDRNGCCVVSRFSVSLLDCQIFLHLNTLAAYTVVVSNRISNKKLMVQFIEGEHVRIVQAPFQIVLFYVHNPTFNAVAV